MRPAYNLTVFCALACLAASPIAANAKSFSNYFSFVDKNSNAIIHGTISGLMDGSDLTADGLTVVVDQAPYLDLLDTYSINPNFGSQGTYNSYTAIGGVLTSANFEYFNADYSSEVFFGSNAEVANYRRLKDVRSTGPAMRT